MPRNLRRSKVLRTITNDATIDKALKEIYDKLDDLQPEKLEKASPLFNKNAPIGSTMLLTNKIGEDSIAIKTNSGWKVDINSKLVSTGDNFNINKGQKTLKGEALLYDASSNLTALNNLSIKNIPQISSDTDKFLMSDRGTIKYVTGDDLKTYIGAGSSNVSSLNDLSDVTYSDGDLTITDLDTIITSNTLVLDSNLNVQINADGGYFDVKNDTTSVYRADSFSPVPAHYFYNTANNSDYLTFTVAANGLTTFSTVDNDGTRGNIVFSPNGKFVVSADMGGVYIDEISAAGDDVAGDGQLWIKDSTPNELCFTDDAGTDIVGVGKYMYDIQRIGYYATATASYIPMTGYVIESTSLTSGNERLAFIAPYNGTIHQVQWRSEIAQNGTTSFRVLESSDGTEVPGTLTGRRDETINIADDTTHTVDLSSMTSGDVNLDKGKIYAFYLSHPTGPQDTNVTIVFKWDITS